jgi:hypothetical protein
MIPETATFDGVPAEQWLEQHLVHDTDPAPAPSRWPTLEAIGLGDALDAVERVCAWAQRGKHLGTKWSRQTVDHQATKLCGHLCRGLYGKETADEDTGEHPFAHVAARALMLLGLVLKK